MVECTDRKLGHLLHAYETGLLSPDDADRFEIHFLECAHCFNQLHEFEEETDMLMADDQIKELVIEDYRDELQGGQSLLIRLWRHLWPEAPLVFKPALAYLVILLLIFPAYQGLQKRTEEEKGIQSVQSINLYPYRVAEEPVIQKDMGDGLLVFVFRGAVPGGIFQVVIKAEDGTEMYREDEFTGFDEYETASLLLPLDEMEPGVYTLKITDPDPGSPFEDQQYSFRIVE